MMSVNRVVMSGDTDIDGAEQFNDRLQLKCTSDWKQAVRIEAAEEGYSGVSQYVRDALPIGAGPDSDINGPSLTGSATDTEPDSDSNGGVE